MPELKFFFKEGKRDEGFSQSDLILSKKGRSLKGFRGFVSLFSCDQDNVAIFLTMWEDDESFSGSQALFASAIDKVMPILEKQPDVDHYRVDTVNFSP